MINNLPINKIIQGDSIKVLSSFPAESIDLVMFSPPYWGLRDYGVEGQIGLESHPQLYIDHMVEVCRAIKRVLKSSGSMYIVVGDTYNSAPPSGKQGGWRRPSRENKNIPIKQKRIYEGNWLQPKQKLMIPSRLWIALQEDGWILRNKIIWFKHNPMPESCKDRYTQCYEEIGFFVKPPAKNYYFNMKAVLQSLKGTTIERCKRGFSEEGKGGYRMRHNKEYAKKIKTSLSPKYTGTNGHSNRAGLNRELSYHEKRRFEVLNIPIALYLRKYIKKHHKQELNKTFGEHRWTHWVRTDTSGSCLPSPDDWLKLKEILGFDEKFDKTMTETVIVDNQIVIVGRHPRDVWQINTKSYHGAHFAVYPEELCIDPIKSIPQDGVVLDPMCGSGTTCVVAHKLGRRWIGIELNSEYVEIARKRLNKAGAYSKKLGDFI